MGVHTYIENGCIMQIHIMAHNMGGVTRDQGTLLTEMS